MKNSSPYPKVGEKWINDNRKIHVVKRVDPLTSTIWTQWGDDLDYRWQFNLNYWNQRNFKRYRYFWQRAWDGFMRWWR